MKYALLIPAIILDTVQFLLGWALIALQFSTPGGGAIAGGLTGALFCWNTSTGVISGIFEAAKCAIPGAFLGTALATFATPIGMAMDVALSITVGGGIILMLGMNGAFHPKIILPRMLGEVMPFFNFLPIWTNMVWRCLQETRKAKGGSGVGLALNFVTASKNSPNGSVFQFGARAMAQQRQATQQPQTPAKNSPRVPLVTRQFSDIRRVAGGTAIMLFLFVGGVAHAQSVPAPIQYILAPETPGAQETVLIEAQGVGSFLGSANITWSQNGKVVKTGIGERNFSFTTGALGEVTTIRVTIDSSQGTFVKTFTFNPSRINLVWEAYTSAPPLYLGKPLYSAGSDYKVVALPTVYTGKSRIAASALTYQWFYKGESVPEASGLGRSVLTRTGDQLQPSERVSVEVYYGVNKVGYSELAIPASAPSILLYQRDALRGVLYDFAIPAAISLAGREITVKAEPYNFSTNTLRSGLIPFVWTLNNNETTGPDSARGILTLRQSGSGKGSAVLGVSMQNNNSEQLIQTARTAVQIVFGAEQSNTLFNFIGL